MLKSSRTNTDNNVNNDDNEENYWVDLPADAIRRIAMFGGVSGIHFCNSCRTFQQHQPHLRILVLFRSKYSIPAFIHHEYLRDEFCVTLSTEGDVHRVIESLPPHYANSITHLYLDAVHHYDNATRGPASLISGPLNDYATNLTSLQTLQISQPSAGHTCPSDGSPSLGDCLVQLCRATSRTLRSVDISACVRLKGIHIFQILQGGKDNLHYFSVLFNEFGVRGRTKGSEETTLRLQQWAFVVCKNLLFPAQVKWHFNKCPWMPTMNTSSQTDFDDDEFRRTFFQTHENQCLIPDDTQTERNHYRPAGYSGSWCGCFDHCIHNNPLPTLGGADTDMPGKIYKFSGLRADCLAQPLNRPAGN